MQNIKEILERQHCFFHRGQTARIAFRKKKLLQLLHAIEAGEAQITQALREDLNKSAFESYETEIGMVLREIRHIVRNLGHWAHPRAVQPWIVHFPASARLYREPYGSVLIMAPWNYPFQLVMVPLAEAVAAGNCVVVKPSAYAPSTARVCREIIRSVFEPEHVAVVIGGREANRTLLQEKFDYIFFTGSQTVGRVVMTAAAASLTPVTLELGGKSPCIVEKTANISLAARRIIWGKLLNSGQTCIAPDYVLADARVKERLITEMRKQIRYFFGEHPEQNPSYPKIINEKHFERLQGLMAGEHLACGGACDRQTGRIAPAILDEAGWDSPVMGEEIFGPLLPVLAFTDLDEAISQIRERPRPLALYLFTGDAAAEKKVMGSLSFGGGCINDTIVHIANTNLPFGGVGASGMGQYHGKAGFETFTHGKTVVKRGTFLDIPLRYPPYGNRIGMLKKLMK